MPKHGDEFCCNKCGRFSIFDLDDDEFTSNLFHNMSVYFGYTSPFDNEKIEFTLCELCLFEFWRDVNINHPPNIIKILLRVMTLLVQLNILIMKTFL